ncbi:MAG: type I secretion system permease/ATPase [Proteobacteria bacterium]|nr:type I secretion system permease/ATPase [Pseudomonadota bacterium]
MALMPRSGNEARRAMGSRRFAIVSIFAFSCLINILMLTGPIYMLQVYDRVMTSASVPTLIALSIIVLVLYAYYGLLEALRSRIMVRLGRAFEESIRNRVFDVVATASLKKLPMAAGSQPLQDMSTIRGFLSGTGPTAFLDMPWVIIYMGVAYILHPWLGFSGVAAAIAILIVAIMTEASSRKPITDAAIASAKANAMTDEARRGSEAMFALGMKGIMRNRWARVQQEAMDSSTRANDVSGGFGSLSRVIRLAVQSGILGLGAYLAINQQITPGAIIAGSIIISRGLSPIETAVANWQQFLAARKALGRLDAALAAIPPDPEPMKLPPPKGLLEVENLIVFAPGSDKAVLQGLTFTVHPGEALGVIGPTGAGKSTLARVLVGIIDPQRGSVRLDGATHDQRNPDELGRAMGYLPQDVQIFDGTVAQNISRFAETPDPVKIVEAAKMANIHELIMKLPNGYDTQLGENGSRLSMGQRQRLALSRALFGDPAILVMDEPNSALDAEGEAALDRAIRATLTRGASVVIVAHRPSALQAVHDILVLNDGKQAAYGKRDEILKRVTQPQRQQQRGEGGMQTTAMITPPVPETRN